MTMNCLFRRYISDLIRITTIILLVLSGSVPCIQGAVTGATITAATGEYLPQDQDLALLITTDTDKETLFKEYHALERECSSLSPGEIMLKVGHCFINRKNMEKGAMLMGVVMSRYDDNLSELDKLNCAIAYGNFGYYLIFERNNPIQAYPFLIKALEIATSLEFDDPENHVLKVNSITGNYTNIAKIFSIFRDHQRALAYYRQAYDIARRDNNPIALPMSFTDLLHYAWTSDSIEAIKTISAEYTELEIPNSAYRHMHEYAKLMSKATLMYDEGSYQEAMALTDSAAHTIDPYVDDRRYIVCNRIIAAKMAMEAKEEIRASGYIEEADGMIQEGRLEDLYELISNTKVEFHKAFGNPELAERFRNRALHVRDSLNHMQSYSVVRNMELSIQAKDYDDKLSASRSETRRWIYTAIGAGILILLICFLSARILIKNRRLKEQTEILFRKNLELIDHIPSQRNNSDIPAAPKEDVSAKEDTIESDIHPEAIEPSAIQSATQEEEEAKTIYTKVQEYMATNDAIFSPSFTIDSLAEALGIKVKEASQAINSIGEKNFNTLLSEYRVKEACRRMLQTANDPARRPTIEALAEEVGYKSRTHFMRVFKSVTGLTTSEFLRQAAAK